MDRLQTYATFYLRDIKGTDQYVGMRLVRGKLAVLHFRGCADCGGEGEVQATVCGHAGVCDCSEQTFQCESCEGEERIEDPDCDCDACCAAQEDADLYTEAHRQMEARAKSEDMAAARRKGEW